MVRVPCCEKMGMKKGPWTPEEDQILISFVQQYGHENWRALPKQAGLLRCGKSCRLRWTNYLRPDIKRGNFTVEEEETIIKLHQMLGNRWSAIATRLPGRTDNEIKNYWHTHLKKRVEQNLTTPKLLRCSAQTPKFRTNNFRTTRWILSLQSEGQNCNSTPAVPESLINLDDCTAASRQNKQESLQANRSLAETNAKGLASEFAMANKYLSIPESRLQCFSSGQSIHQHRDDSINTDMDFWYNLFISAGKS